MAEQYSFLEVSAFVNGVEITDWAEGDDVIVAERRNDAVTDVMGARGKMAIAISADQSGTVTLRVKQTSAVNSLLQGIVQASQNGSPQLVNFTMRDSLRQDLVQGTIGYVQNMAPVTRGAGINEAEWVLVFEKLYMLNGNVSVSGIGALVGGIAGGLLGGAFA
jgi:hypothetical protein